jgi:hypothetical protein
MKQLSTIIFIALFAAGIAFSQEAETTVAISGELKTGAFWYDRTQYDAAEKYGNSQGAFVHNGEDTDWTKGTTDYNVFKDQPGRFRLNFQVDHENIGTKFRFEAASTDISSANPPIKLSYAFAYGYFWDRQIKISAGKMGIPLGVPAARKCGGNLTPGLVCALN